VPRRDSSRRPRSARKGIVLRISHKASLDRIIFDICLDLVALIRIPYPVIVRLFLLKGFPAPQQTTGLSCRSTFQRTHQALGSYRWLNHEMDAIRHDHPSSAGRLEAGARRVLPWRCRWEITEHLPGKDGAIDGDEEPSLIQWASGSKFSNTKRRRDESRRGTQSACATLSSACAAGDLTSIPH